MYRPYAYRSQYRNLRIFLNFFKWEAQKLTIYQGTTLPFLKYHPYIESTFPVIDPG